MGKHNKTLDGQTQRGPAVNVRLTLLSVGAMLIAAAPSACVPGADDPGRAGQPASAAMFGSEDVGRVLSAAELHALAADQQSSAPINIVLLGITPRGAGAAGANGAAGAAGSQGSSGNQGPPGPPGPAGSPLLGEVRMWAGPADGLPGGWLLCDGSEASRDGQARLFRTIGVKFGAGNGSTTFNLPDLRNHFLLYPEPTGASGSGSSGSGGSGSGTSGSGSGGTSGSGTSLLSPAGEEFAPLYATLDTSMSTTATTGGTGGALALAGRSTAALSSRTLTTAALNDTSIQALSPTSSSGNLSGTTTTTPMRVATVYMIYAGE